MDDRQSSGSVQYTKDFRGRGGLVLRRVAGLGRSSGRASQQNYPWRVRGAAYFSPLGMNSTTFHLEQKPHVREKLMTMSARGPGGELLPGPSRILVDPAPEEMGGTGLYSCAILYPRAGGPLKGVPGSAEERNCGYDVHTATRRGY